MQTTGAAKSIISIDDIPHLHKKFRILTNITTVLDKENDTDDFTEPENGRPPLTIIIFNKPFSHQSEQHCPSNAD